MRQFINLERGSKVRWQGREFEVTQKPDGFDGVLCMDQSTKQRVFIALAELEPATDIHGTAAEAEGSTQAAGADTTPANGEGKPQPADKPTGRWKQRLKARVVPATPIRPNWTPEIADERKALMAHREELLAILAMPKGSAERAKATETLATRRGYSTATAYRNLAIVEQGTDLARAQRSDSGTIRLSVKQLQAIKDAFLAYRYVAEKWTMPRLRKLINGQLRGSEEPEVSLETLYKYERLDKTKKQRLEAEGRKEQVRNAFASAAGQLPDADFPLAIVEIDHTRIQVIFVDEESRESIGDAWITLIIDCFSRMVLGYYLSYDAPSTLSVGLALARAFLPKEKYLEEMEISGSWPCWGKPVVIICDNAAELNGYMMQTAARDHFFDIRDRPVGGPQFGGHIESGFKTFMHRQRSLPGTKFSNPQERAEYNSKEKSALSLRDYERLFTEYVVNDYHLNEHRGDGMKRRCPRQVWEAGIFDGDKVPPTGLPERPSPEMTRHLYIGLCPVEYRVVAKMRVEIFTEEYSSDEIVDVSDSIDPSDPTKLRKFEIRYDPRNIAVIWLRHPNTGQYMSLYVQNVTWTHLSLREHEQMRAAWGKPAEQYREEQYSSMLRQEQLVQTSVTKTKAERRRRAQSKRDEAAALTPKSEVNKVTAANNPLLEDSLEPVIVTKVQAPRRTT